MNLSVSHFAGANAKLRYQITSGNVGGIFDMEPEVGTIFIVQPLDYEQHKLYKLHVLASDGKWEDYSSVIVTIVNKNDEAPVFSVNEYYGSVTEELDGSPVFVLQVPVVVWMKHFIMFFISQVLNILLFYSNMQVGLATSCAGYPTRHTSKCGVRSHKLMYWTWV